MIKLSKIVNEIKVVKPLRLNSKGKILLDDYKNLERICKLFEINEEGGNLLYKIIYDIDWILNIGYGYSNNGVTSVEQIKQYLKDERYGDDYEDEIEDFNAYLKNILEYFS